MPLLFSNFPPVRTEYPTYTETFKNLLRLSDTVKIATGYISSDSAVDIKSIVESNGGPHIDLCVGMHYFDGLTLVQSDALKELNNSLKKNDLGGVHMVTTFPFHGKVVSFSKNNSIIGSIVGSSNLSNIIDGQRQYEVDYLIEEEKSSKDLRQFIENLILVASNPLESTDVKIIQPTNNLLENNLNVRKVETNEIHNALKQLTNVNFRISLKGDDAPKSGLNVFFGEGRRNTQGFIIPRPWYEVELIVPKAITQNEDYPKANATNNSGSFNVVTDDGWAFKCKVSGDYSKNFRSEDDLKILGKWIKGRLENTGALKPGEIVTNATLEKYGRSDITLTKIANSQDWYLDFGVNNG